MALVRTKLVELCLPHRVVYVPRGAPMRDALAQKNAPTRFQVRRAPTPGGVHFQLKVNPPRSSPARAGAQLSAGARVRCRTLRTRTRA